MNENIKLTTSIIAKTTFKWLFIFVLGNLVTLIVFLIALFTNLDSLEGGRVGHAGGGIMAIIFFLEKLFFTNFFALILVLGFPIFIAIYFMTANKMSIQNALYLLWEGKAGDYILPKVKTVIKKITEKEGWRKNISNKVMLKASLLQLAKEEKDTSKLQRKIISFVFEKINLDDIDFQNEELNLSDVLISKFEGFISEISKPSMKIFWILILFQIIILIISFIG